MRMKLTYPDELMNPANEFAAAINEFYEMLLGFPQRPWGIEEMKKLLPELTKLSALAYQLPPVDDYEVEELQKQDNAKGFLSIRMDFDEEYQHYYALFYPYEGIKNRRAGPDNPIMGDLVDDMYGICNDLQRGLEYYENGMIYRAVYSWRESFKRHWGEHASQAVYAMDHAVRDYICNEDMGKYDVPFENYYYPSVKHNDLDGYFILHLEPVDTGLPYELVINTLGLMDDDIPMIGVVVGENVIFVSVAENPNNLSRISFPGQEKIFKWVSQYRERLEKHWNKEMTDRELLNSFYKDVMDIFPPEDINE